MNPTISIRDLYTMSYPVGPAVAEDPMAEGRLSLLFDNQNKLVSQLNHEKALIIGRKGSGKTTLLVSVQLSEPTAEIIYLPSNDIFAKIVREVNKLSDGVVFVEQVGRLWDFIFWGIVINHVAATYDDKDLSEYCRALGIEDVDEPYILIEKMLSTIKSFPPTDWPIPEKIAYKKFSNHSFLQAKQIAVTILKRAKAQIYLLMDSLEEFQLHIPSCAAAIAGLLRCLGEFNEMRRAPVVLRCCLPAERYFDYTEVSTNPLKDFRGGMLLHWSAGELIQLCAVRYSKFLEEYNPEFYRDYMRDLNLHKRDDLEKFWDLIFPNPVVGRLGIHERPIAYILRHTQLLPRHFIVYMNEIISRSLKEASAAYDISSDYVQQGISEVEGMVLDQILQSYTTPTRDVRRACAETLKELKTTFTWSDFDTIAGKVTKRGIPGVSDSSELMSILTEIGAVGRVVGKSEKYYEGVFEYMVPHKLVLSERDSFCIHPVFTEAFNVNTDYEGIKAIYTYWSGITDSDLAHWM